MTSGWFVAWVLIMHYGWFVLGMLCCVILFMDCGLIFGAIFCFWDFWLVFDPMLCCFMIVDFILVFRYLYDCCLVCGVSLDYAFWLIRYGNVFVAIVLMEFGLTFCGIFSFWYFWLMFDSIVFVSWSFTLFVVFALLLWLLAGYWREFWLCTSDGLWWECVLF